MASAPVVRFAIDALATELKTKRKQNMPVLITIITLFAVQFYTPAFAGAWSRASGSGYVALKRGGVSGSALLPVPQQIGEANSGGDLQSSTHTQTQEAYGEYALSEHILFAGKYIIQNTRTQANIHRTTYHELGLQTLVPFLAFGLLPPGSLSALRLAFPGIKFTRDTAAAAQVFHHHTLTKTHNAEGPISAHKDGGGLTVAIADRLSWKRYHLTQSLAVTQFNSRSSGIWKNDYEIHMGYADQISLGWINEIYEDHDRSYANRNSYVAVGFSAPNYKFNVRVLLDQSAVAGRQDTYRSYRLEVGWSFP